MNEMVQAFGDWLGSPSWFWEFMAWLSTLFGAQ